MFLTRLTETLQETQDLCNEISKLEHLVKRNANQLRGKFHYDNKLKKVEMQKKENVFTLNQFEGIEKKKIKIEKQDH